MQTIPVDLILHSLHALLLEHPGDEAPGIYATGIAMCIDRGRLAEEWAQDTDADVDWLMRSLDPVQREFVTAHHITTDTRAMEVAIARRLADTAFALTIEQDAEATRTAATLLRAAQAIVGLVVAPAGFKRPTMGEHIDKVRADILKSADASPPPPIRITFADVLRARLPTGYEFTFTTSGKYRWDLPKRNAHGAEQDAIGAFIDAWRDAERQTVTHPPPFAEVAQALGLAADMAPATVVAHAREFREKYVHAAVEMAAAHRRLAEPLRVCDNALETDAAPCDHPQCAVSRLRDILRPDPGETIEEAARRLRERYASMYAHEGTWQKIAADHVALMQEIVGRLPKQNTETAAKLKTAAIKVGDRVRRVACSYDHNVPVDWDGVVIDIKNKEDFPYCVSGKPIHVRDNGVWWFPPEALIKIA